MLYFNVALKRTNAPDGWDDQVTSFIVQPDCELTGYENADKNGHMFSFAAGSYEAPKDNTMSSWICTCGKRISIDCKLFISC